MTMILKTLGAALAAAGLLAAAQAAPVALSAVIDFDEPSIGLGSVITNQYAQFGLVFTTNNVVTCSKTTNASCGAPRQFPPPPHTTSPNFLMNGVAGSGFSINVLTGFSLSSLTLDIAANTTTFFVKFFDARGAAVSTPVSWATGSNFHWDTEVLAGVNSAVRRIEFGGSNTTSFAIDDLRFDYVVDSTNVPEPTALSLVALALAGVALSLRRKG